MNDSPAGVLSASGRATPARTLVDVLEETAARHPEEAALEDAEGVIGYRELLGRVRTAAGRLHEAGVRPGDRVGIRVPSGSADLYVAILAVLTAGAAYVPVDADDPEERADTVFDEAGVAGVVTAGGRFTPAPGGPAAGRSGAAWSATDTAAARPAPGDDAWIIFTSGSTGTPKGVAVTHRSAAAFVDAEARLFLQADPIGPGDRVLAGLSVAFDASCEEMWLAWRHGACLVPAPRSLVRSGMDLGPWLTARGVTVVSTVPTLAALWPAESLENVRLLIFGGEACPPELAARLAVDGREVWNTYGPTEATVVACAAPLDGRGPVRIGLPLDGWDLAVIGADGRPVGPGEVGELVIGGVGLARYLDPDKDAVSYAPLDALGWERAYRSGDQVRFEEAGLLFEGRTDDQVKVGGRRIELGEIEARLQELPGVAAAAAAVRSTSSGVDVLVGYVVAAAGFDRADALERLRAALPAALVPLLAAVAELPVRTSGKVDRDALPWPLPGVDPEPTGLDPALRGLAAHWQAVLGVPVDDADANFFDLGGGSLSAAQLVSRVRREHPEFAVSEVYEHPRLGAMAEVLADSAANPGSGSGSGPAGGGPGGTARRVGRTPRRMQWVQTALGAPLFVLDGVRWVLYLLTAGTLLGDTALGDALLDALPGGSATGGAAAGDLLPRLDPLPLLAGLALFATPFGRMAIAVVCARILLAGVRPGDHPRGGSVHLRLWLADQIGGMVGAAGLAGAPWITYYARALGARIGRDVDLHTLPPVTGMLTVGRGASIEPEVDLAGYWVDGDVVRVGPLRIGARSTVGARSTLLPGATIGRDAEIAPGSAVFGRVPPRQRWVGSPAVRAGRSRTWWPARRPPRRTRWLIAYALSSTALSLLPVVALLAGALVLLAAAGDATTPAGALAASWWAIVPAVAVAGTVAATTVLVLVRLLGLGVREGTYPVRSRVGWQVWSTERLLDLSRTLLFPLYSSLFTPVWLRLLGARVGRDVEASTVLLLPAMTTIRDGAFLADDTLVASYELGGGWVRVARAEIGERSFLGNSGMAAAGHRVPRDGLVAVLSAAPRTSKAGSSWLGSPPMRLRRTAATTDLSRTFRPPRRVRAARVCWELCRFVPVVATCAIGLGVIAALAAAATAWGVPAAVLVSGPVLMLAGAVAAATTTAAKWLLVGRIRAGEHPLWSSFVWRSEVADTFVEMVAAPWFARAAAGTPALVWWLRSLGARIGRGVWCDTYWLPEADLVRLGDGATVNRGCVLQTHLFHDRIMSMGAVELEDGATLGPHGVILPAARIGTGATVGPASLVMRGEAVPAGSRWSGNPIGPWRQVTVGEYHASPGGR